MFWLRDVNGDGGAAFAAFTAGTAGARVAPPVAGATRLARRADAAGGQATGTASAVTSAPAVPAV
ncbi:hypothetical protein, partial [Mycobacterium tuberculosis]